MKNKSWLSIEKNIIKGDKTPYYNYKNVFSYRKIVFSWSMKNRVFPVSIRNFTLGKNWFFQGSAKKDFTLGFQNFNRKTKSNVMPKYKRVQEIFYFMA